MADTTYQPKIYRKSGGNIEVVASSGELELESGSKVDMQSGSEFQFYDTDFTADKMRNFMLSQDYFVDYYISGAVSFFNVSQLVTNYGYHCWSGATTDSLGSVTLPAPDSGCILHLIGLKLAGDGNLSVLTSGTSMINNGSILISSFELSALGWAKLLCVSAGQWLVVDGNYTEHLAA